MRRSFHLLRMACAAGVLAFTSAQAADNPAPQIEQSGPSDRQAANAGREVFMNARCFACHGEYGFGGVGPRFRQNDFLRMGDYVVGQILLGRGVMPSFAEALDNRQIASWGNRFGEVAPDEVAKVRNQIKAHGAQDRPRVAGPYLPKNMPRDEAMQPEKPLPPGQPLPPKADR